MCNRFLGFFAGSCKTTVGSDGSFLGTCELLRKFPALGVEVAGLAVSCEGSVPPQVLLGKLTGARLGWADGSSSKYAMWRMVSGLCLGEMCWCSVGDGWMQAASKRRV